jgi:hypothetical protein
MMSLLLHTHNISIYDELWESNSHQRVPNVLTFVTPNILDLLNMTLKQTEEIIQLLCTITSERSDQTLSDMLSHKE